MLFFCVSSRASTNDKEINSNKTGRVVAEMPQRDPNLVTPTGLSQWLSGEESACSARDSVQSAVQALRSHVAQSNDAQEPQLAALQQEIPSDTPKT